MPIKKLRGVRNLEGTPGTLLMFSIIGIIPITNINYLYFHVKSNYHRQQTFEEWDKLFAIHRDECIKESGIYKEDAYDMEKIVTFPNYYGFKCYLKCQQNRLQLIAVEGLPNAAKITGLGAGVDEEMITKCLPEILDTTNECDKSYNFARCLYEVLSGFNDN
ncbi:hypothetical protein FQA39_LY08006 [Lamprigera yunnana]|nr:hypothetical protein FQA39_LY08006 [Lamprigera yunnana]